MRTSPSAAVSNQRRTASSSASPGPSAGHRTAGRQHRVTPCGHADLNRLKPGASRE